MAEEYVIEKATLTAIADSIRAKKGTTADIVPENMPEEIASIEGGGGGGELDAFLDGSLTELTSNAENVRDHAFYLASTLTKIELPLAISASGYAFTGCEKLVNIYCPNLQKVGTNAFESCKLLKKIDLPLCESLAAAVFRFCYSLKTVLLRNDSVCSLAAVSAFYQSYHFHGTVNATYNPDGLKDGYIYVPRSLVDSYKAATNWSTFADQFRALEDYTVDGTITGELDETKI